MKKDDNIIIRVDSDFKEEFRLYFNKVSKKVLGWMEEELEKERLLRLGPVMRELKGNRYAAAAIDTAINDIVFYKSEGLDEECIEQKVSEMLKEKFDVEGQASSLFFQRIYREVYGCDAELLFKHRGSITRTINEHVNGGRI
ncbi:hypothetical protein DFR58_1475 [Anaerobacterium chartisolvens]|uniref:Uncharacterized protein n=1 Tax=Anaerobacterium chartisolvens TaxID=1297424 RepID=A0A369AFJ6_9FIRM|nr:hypothetical protein [Anaerobacterium chartisolvens]RCX07885.1 hypothetical protein DFR58_1475 [Anaerobacterium chartisolvens]